jgi:hypothetical protein
MLNYSVLTQQPCVDRVVGLISSAEGHRAVAAQPPNDPNTTIGYGYTFNRVYPSRINLATTRMRIDANSVDLSPGMAVTVEIKTGQRRLIEYFLSPLIQASAESARER